MLLRSGLVRLKIESAQVSLAASRGQRVGMLSEDWTEGSHLYACSICTARGTGIYIRVAGTDSRSQYDSIAEQPKRASRDEEQATKAGDDGAEDKGEDEVK